MPLNQTNQKTYQYLSVTKFRCDQREGFPFLEF